LDLEFRGSGRRSSRIRGEYLRQEIKVMKFMQDHMIFGSCEVVAVSQIYNFLD